MTEAKLYAQKLRPLRSAFPVTTYRLEPGATTRSIPDVYYITPEVTGWIELKILKQRRDGSFYIPYRPGQIGWLKHHIRSNNKTFCLAWYDNEMFLFNTFYEEYKSLTDIMEQAIWFGRSLNNPQFFKLVFRK